MYVMNISTDSFIIDRDVILHQ